ncbi:hypothetical protein LZ31DRAFT_65637 [Colletotrichum somersetense]|nr:hypothetical protein LZ31DRAFT_65637 [Colletotrichum somersetense]
MPCTSTYRLVRFVQRPACNAIEFWERLRDSALELPTCTSSLASLLLGMESGLSAESCEPCVPREPMPNQWSNIPSKQRRAPTALAVHWDKGAAAPARCVCMSNLLSASAGGVALHCSSPRPSELLSATRSLRRRLIAGHQRPPSRRCIITYRMSRSRLDSPPHALHRRPLHPRCLSIGILYQGHRVVGEVRDRRSVPRRWI